MPSPPREGAWCFVKQCKLCAKSFIGPSRKPGNISLLFSLLLSYRQLWTTRFGSIKGPTVYICQCYSPNLNFRSQVNSLPPCSFPLLLPNMLTSPSYAAFSNNHTSHSLLQLPILLFVFLLEAKLPGVVASITVWLNT